MFENVCCFVAAWLLEPQFLYVLCLVKGGILFTFDGISLHDIRFILPWLTIKFSL